MSVSVLRFLSGATFLLLAGFLSLTATSSSSHVLFRTEPLLATVDHAIAESLVHALKSFPLGPRLLDYKASVVTNTMPAAIASPTALQERLAPYASATSHISTNGPLTICDTNTILEYTSISPHFTRAFLDKAQALVSEFREERNAYRIALCMSHGQDVLPSDGTILLTAITLLLVIVFIPRSKFVRAHFSAAKATSSLSAVQNKRHQDNVDAKPAHEPARFAVVDTFCLREHAIPSENKLEVDGEQSPNPAQADPAELSNAEPLDTNKSKRNSRFTHITALNMRKASDGVSKTSRAPTTSALLDRTNVAPRPVQTEPDIPASALSKSHSFHTHDNSPANSVVYRVVIPSTAAACPQKASPPISEPSDRTLAGSMWAPNAPEVASAPSQLADVRESSAPRNENIAARAITSASKLPSKDQGRGLGESMWAPKGQDTTTSRPGLKRSCGLRSRDQGRDDQAGGKAQSTRTQRLTSTRLGVASDANARVEAASRPGCEHNASRVDGVRRAARGRPYRSSA